MKHILFIRNLDTEEDVKKIKDAMEGTRVEFEVLLDNRCVVIYGRNDLVYAAKVALNEAGFIIE